MPDKPTFADLFAGIGGFRLGLERAGWQCKWSCEIDRFCRQVYAKNFGKEPEYGDIREVENPPYVDLMCGGFPCQDLSVAGKRAGIKGERSGLFFEFVRLLEQVRPAWFLLENVPGWFSSHKGRDFAVALFHLDKCGYGLPWRILDAQYFGVPQQRRRVFILGCQGKPCPPEILFESQGGGRDTQKGQKAGQGIARAIATGSNPHRYDGDTENFIVGTIAGGSERCHSDISSGQQDHNLIIASPLSAGSHDQSHTPGRRREDDYNLVIASAITAGYRKGAGVNDGKRGSPQNLIIYHENISGNVAGSETARSLRHGASHSYQFVSTSANTAGVRTPARVSRRMDKPEMPDGPRYKALGNAVAVPVVEWIGRRLIGYMRLSTGGSVDAGKTAGL